MAILRIKEMRMLDEPSLDKKLDELRDTLNSELGFIASGGRASNPGRIKEIRRTIARILTIKRERNIKMPEPRPGSAG